MNAPKKPRRSTVEVVDSRYQPSKAELEEDFTLPELTPEEAVRALTQPLDIRYVSRPSQGKKKKS